MIEAILERRQQVVTEFRGKLPKGDLSGTTDGRQHREKLSVASRSRAMGFRSLDTRDHGSISFEHRDRPSAGAVMFGKLNRPAAPRG